MPGSKRPRAARRSLVPQQGVTRNQRGEATALVIGADDKVELRILKVDRVVGDKWLATDGLKAGDRVIIDGLPKVKPGIAVRVVPAGTTGREQPGATSVGALKEELVMSKFFIERPVFAWVIALVLMLAGALAIDTLPISQYPSIAPPQVAITVAYPGASAQTVQDTVVQVIEQQMNGLDGLEYLASQGNSDGSMEIDLTFRQGTNPDIAQVQVQNKLQLATPLLPQEVQQQGIRVTKATKNFLVVLAFVSTDGSMNRYDLADFIASSVQDPISRTPGVGDFTLFGSQYAMRIWLDPTKLNNFGLTAQDVVVSIKAQNVQVATGQLGGRPSSAGQQLTATIIGPSRLQSPGDFDKILLKVSADGSQVRLRDVGRSELGGETYAVEAQFNGKPASGLAVRLATGANALDTIEAVDATIERLKPFFPTGLEVVHAYDTTPFVRLSIREVVETLGEAIVLVFLVMYLFLQNFRATLIPTIAVPVVLLGTFAVLSAAGYSINTLTMFAMVLAIGLLVDDAIVVVENVERVMSEEGLSPKEATKKSMQQITGALVGIALVLAAVFLPMAFFGGSTGVIYRQFSITMVSAMVLSVLVALILTPALCATLLKPVVKGGHLEKGGFFGWFNRNFDRGNRGYISSVSGVLGRPVRFLVLYLGVVVVMGLLFTRLATSFLPEEDQGILFVQVQTPPGATNLRTDAVLDQVRDYFTKDEKESVESVFTVSGFGFNGRGQNAGLAFVKLKDWGLRSAPERKVHALAARAMRRFAAIKDAMVFAFAPPAVIELGNANGFDLELQDRAGIGHDKLMEARNQFLGMAAQSPGLIAVRPNGLEDAPQYRIFIDREKANAFGLSISDIDDTLSTAWGSSYVNDFINRGRVKKVFIQGDAPSRMMPEDLNRWYVRNGSGAMVPFSAFASGSWAFGPQKLERYNGVPALEILGQAAPGQSTGAAMAAVEALTAKLPPGVGFEWTGLSYEERLAGAQAPALYAISLVVVFLSLAALYESWSIPVAVMMVVPLGVVGTISATWLRGLSNDVYFQVGLLTTVGLAAKKRHSDRRIRQGLFRSRGRSDGGRHSGGPATVASDLDDVAGFHPGCFALGNRLGGRFRRPERHRYGGDRRHADRHFPGHRPGSAFLRRHFTPVPGQAPADRRRGLGSVQPAFEREMSMMTKTFLPLLAGAAFLGGCSLIPDYDRPAAPTATAWPTGPAYGMTPAGQAERQASADIGWRDFFTDRRLQSLIALALDNNRDLRVAALTVEATRAQYQIEQADLFPSIEASGSGLNERLPARLSTTGRPMVSRQYSVGVGFTSYELDLFGRVRSLQEEALEQYFAQDDTRISTQITLVAAVANAYFNLLADQELLRLTEDTLASQRQSYDLTRQSNAQGVASELDLRQAETSVRSAEANLAQYTRQVAQDRNALALLVGQSLPPALEAALAAARGLDADGLLADLPAGVPSALIERRPDVRAAEHSLKAANANIGAARAAFFPTITLTATGGVASNGLSELFRGASRTWTFAPNISVPIFEGGRLEAGLDYAKTMKNIEVARYEKTIQTAFREVSDALAARGTFDDQMQAQQSLVDASAVRYRLSELRFRNGVEGYLNTLDAQRTLYGAQQTLIVTRLSRLSNLVTLYKTLGGGWSERTEQLRADVASGPSEDRQGGTAP